MMSNCQLIPYTSAGSLQWMLNEKVDTYSDRTTAKMPTISNTTQNKL